MSSMTIRGLLCLAVAFAMFAGVGIWAYQYSHPPVLAIVPMQSGKGQKAIAVGERPEPKNGFRPRPEPKAGVPAVEEPMPVEEQPRFFQKGFKGFGKKAPRANLSERFGVSLQKPSEDTVLQLGISEADGLVIEQVRAGSIAELAGMKVGDVLLTLDGQNVPSDVEQFHFQLENLKTNEAIDAVLLRDGKMETLKGIILPEAPQRSFPFQRRVF